MEVSRNHQYSRQHSHSSIEARKGSFELLSANTVFLIHLCLLSQETADGLVSLTVLRSIVVHGLVPVLQS